MCVHDAEHDFQNSVFKVIGYVKYEFNFFLVLKFLTSRWSFGWWSVHLVGGWLVGDRWSVVGWSVGRWSVVGGRLVGGFKETLFKSMKTRKLLLLLLAIYVDSDDNI